MQYKDSKYKRTELVKQFMERQYARTQKDGSSGEYTHKLKEKPYALIYAERMKNNEQHTES